jgi:Holliday junction resolvase|tara:strand:- start:133 stop:510 length:378 start_codon:yes stop_codon:yes gene_type:complete
MGPEAKLYKKLKAKSPRIIWTRIENLSLLGCPDLLGYNANRHFFTVELKVTKRNKLKFSPHQIAFHKSHPKNTFILAMTLGHGSVKLFHGSKITELVACGFKLDACCLGLDACVSYLEQVGSKAL